MGFIIKTIVSVLLFSFLAGTAFAENYKAYEVVKESGSEVLISDGYDFYLIDYNWDCSSSDFSEGDIIYIDTYYNPSFGDDILVELWDGSYDVCSVSSAEELNLKDYYVEDVIDFEDQIIVQGDYGDRYLVEYGIGCLSMWRYGEKYIQIDVGGAFLDGISDRIYLFDNDDDCKVWDVQDLGSDYGATVLDLLLYPSYSEDYSSLNIDQMKEIQDLKNQELDFYLDFFADPENQPLANYILTGDADSSCGENQYLGENFKCYCEDGYTVNEAEDACITLDQWCEEQLGDHVYYSLDGEQCYCEEGFTWDDEEYACVEIDLDQFCSEDYGKNALSTGEINENGTYTCICKEGFKWNDDSSGCREIEANEFEIDVENITNIFSDVEVDNKNAEAILYLYNKGVINGYDNGTFKPHNDVNRAELLKIIIEGKKFDVLSSDYDNCFKDVKTEWFAPYVCYAKSVGWVEGYSDGTFKPAQTVNKVEALKMLLNAYGYIPENGEFDASSLYNDVKVNDWFAPFVSKAKQLGILEETGSVFFPNEGMTRGSISENLYRLLTF